MAVMRVQSIKVSNLRGAIKHRLSPPRHEVLVAKGVVVDSSAEEFKALFEEFVSVCEDELKMHEEFFKIVESKGYKHKIRKNATIQEVLISYSSEDFSKDLGVVSRIKEDVGKFVETFREKFGFEPFCQYYIHRNDKGMYHVHLLFSLMKPDLSKKVKWNSKTYFELVKKFSKRATRVKFSESRKSGVYPLWLIRSFEKVIGREKTKEVIKVARKRGLNAVDLVELLRKLRVKQVNLTEFFAEGWGTSERRFGDIRFCAKSPMEGVQEQRNQREEAIKVLQRIFLKKRKSGQSP